MRRPNLVEEEIIIKILESKLKIKTSEFFISDVEQSTTLTTEEKKTLKKLKANIEKSLKKLEWYLDGYEVTCQELFNYAEELYIKNNLKNTLPK